VVLLVVLDVEVVVAFGSTHDAITRQTKTDNVKGRSLIE